MKIDYEHPEEAIEKLHNDRSVLRIAIKMTLEENRHLADGNNCTLIHLKKALAEIGD